MQLYYASRDGQTRRIAERLSTRLAAAGTPAHPRDLVLGIPAAAELTNAPLVVLVAAVRYGKHLREADDFLTHYGRLRQAPPLVFLSINLTARKPAKRSAEGSVYLRKAIRRHNLKPVLAEAIAGRLDYPRYSWHDRQAIRFIMMLTGGPTDPSAQIEFTDWNQVDGLASRIAELMIRGAGAD